MLSLAREEAGKWPAGATVVNPNGASYDFADARDRFASMSITRNPTGCIIPRSQSAARKSGAEAGTPATDRHFLSTADIRGAVPKAHYAAKERATFYDTADIDGAAPSAMHKPKTGHFDILGVRDIEGTRSRTLELRTKRVVDPLNPEYKLPSFETRPASPPPFKRDSYSIADIEGTRAVTRSPIRPRATKTAEDIDGARPKPVIREASGHYDMLDVSDINRGEVFRTARVTDNLMPSYTIHGMYIHDDDHRAACVKMKPREGSFMPLLTSDIAGAQPPEPGNTRVGAVRVSERKEFLITNRLDDIDGASAGTRVEGIRRHRDTNPNEREYRLLDGTSSLATDVSVGRTWHSVAALAVARRAAATAAAAAAAAGVPAVSPAIDNPLGLPGGSEARMVKKAVANLDPREVEVARLRAEVERLRVAAASGSAPSTRPARGREPDGGAAEAIHGGGGSAAAGSVRRTGSSAGSTLSGAARAMTAGAAAVAAHPASTSSSGTSTPASGELQSGKHFGRPKPYKVSVPPDGIPFDTTVPYVRTTKLSLALDQPRSAQTAPPGTMRTAASGVTQQAGASVVGGGSGSATAFDRRFDVPPDVAAATMKFSSSSMAATFRREPPAAEPLTRQSARPDMYVTRMKQRAQLDDVSAVRSLPT